MAAVSRRTGFVLAAYAFFVVMLGTTLPTPLYPLLQRRYSFGELLVTVIFAIYAFGVIAGLLVFGNLSDQLGRKPLLLLGLGFSAVNALLFLFAGSLVPIFAARVISGLSAGIYTGTATAFLVDLAPEAKRRRASLVAVAVNLGGLGCGTLLSGLLAAYARDPLRAPFAADLALLVPAAAGLLLAPETVERRRFRYRFQRLGVPAELRTVFVRGATAGFASFAVAGVFSSVAPVFLGVVLDRKSPALAGLLVFLFFGMSLLGQIVVRRLSERSSLAIGCILLLIGTILLGVSLGVETLAPLIASSIVAGIGQGIVFGAALTAINQQAPAERRGETASSFFVVAYVGLSLPVIAAGVAIYETSLKTAGIAFCVGVAVLVLAVLASQLRSSRR
ncbi:MAG TPA: MFS transporter [Gaiellaceae bacterium]|nr:MFS transporter [Gaiellaceae bacterium]